MLPLAPVSNVAQEQVPGVLLAISDRLAREASPEQAATLWSATRILMGLRYREEQVEAIIEGVSAMLFGIEGIEESSVYQGILRKGEARGAVEEAQKILLRLGCKKFGPPGEPFEAELIVMGDLERLRNLIDRLFEVSSWDELFAPGDLSA